jgi:hypothetical protein
VNGYSLRNLLSGLGVKKGDVILLHSSYKRIAYLKLTASQILEAIIESIGGEGTLILPAYAWSGTPEGYREYFEKRPVFDVRHTPVHIGHLPETFRLMPGVKRSLSYWWSVCASGKQREVITENQEKISDSYGQGSSFEILRENNVKILGLGVSLNTTSLSPIVDFKLGNKHTQRVFTEAPQTGILLAYDGNRIDTKTHWLLPDYVRSTKPSRLIEYSEKFRNAIFRNDEGTTIQFCYEFNAYYEEAMRLGLEANRRSSKMPWLENYGQK